jgi:hypothetical protein
LRANTRLRSRRCAAGALRTLDGPSELNPRRDADLAEDIAQVRLDGLPAEEQLGGDFRIGLSVGDESCELKLTLGQRFKPTPVRAAWARAPVDAIAEPAQPAFRLIPVAERSAFLEVAGCALQLGPGAVTVAGLSEREAG